MRWLGIDTGTNTGMALWDSRAKRFLFIKSTTAYEALTEAKKLFDSGNVDIIAIEDARLNKTTFGNKLKPYYALKNQKDYNLVLKIAQDVGGVMRDAAIWEEFCKLNDIEYRLVKPNKNSMTKMGAEFFKNYYDGKTNEHGRDAAALVLGR